MKFKNLDIIKGRVKDVKLCKDCRFSTETDNVFSCWSSFSLKYEVTGKFLVTGEIDSKLFPLCEEVRNNSTACGWEGNRWEPKDTKKRKIWEVLRILDRE